MEYTYTVVILLAFVVGFLFFNATRKLIIYIQNKNKPIRFVVGYVQRSDEGMYEFISRINDHIISSDCNYVITMHINATSDGRHSCIILFTHKIV